MTDIAVIILSILATPQRSEPVSPVATLIVLILIGGLVYAWNVWRWREVAWCRKCDGKGSFQSTSPILRRPIRRPCPRCKPKGGPWRRRRLSPRSDES